MIRRQALQALAVLPLAAARPSRADTVLEGQTFASVVRVAGQDLRLNGVGLRAVAWLKGYAAGLYLMRRSGDAAEVMAMPGPKRLQLRMLQEASSVEFVKAFDRGVKRNLGEDRLPPLAERMRRFDSAIASLGMVRKGDVVDLDFDPAQGLLFTRNGRRVGEPVPGADFYAALLSVFIGPKPTDPELKTGLLGGPIS